MQTDRKLLLLVIPIVLLGAILILFLATRWGIGVSPDSVVYIQGARHLLSGDGYSMISAERGIEPITHHAPFYSFALALFSISGFDTVEVARWFNILLLCSNILLVVIILYYLQEPKPKYPVIPVAAAILIATSTTILEIHSKAWTEPLFILLGNIGVFLLGLYLDRSKLVMLVVSAVFVGLATLTRYAGISLIATGVICIILFDRRKWLERLAYSAVFGLVGVLPLAIWMLRNYIVASTTTNRQFSIHPIRWSQIEGLISTLSSWMLVPENNSLSVKVLVLSLFALTAIGFFVWIRVSNNRNTNQALAQVETREFPGLIKIYCVFLVLYLGFLFFSMTFLDANIPLDRRILSPLYYPFLIVILYLAMWIWGSVGKLRVLEISLVGLCLLFLLGHSVVGITMLKGYYNRGIGYNSLIWRNSETIARLADFPAELVFYSNAPEAIYLHTQRPAFRLPVAFESSTQRANPDYYPEVERVLTEIEDQEAVIIFFEYPGLAQRYPRDELIQVFQPGILLQVSDGTVFGVE